MLAAKMVVTVAFVVVASWTAERAGAVVGALVATLPISAAPAYIFLAIDHDVEFIAAAALASLSANAANVAFCLAYTLVAQSRGLAVSLAGAVATWLAVTAVASWFVVGLAGAIILNLIAFAICTPAARRFRDVVIPVAERYRYDIPIRAGMVAVLVATVVTLSSRLGPLLTGALAVFPIVLTSMALIFQPRVGGPATAAITANGILGLAGYGLALVLLHVAAVPIGLAVALILALSVSIGWNLAVLTMRAGNAAIRQPAGVELPVPVMQNRDRRSSA